MYSVRSQSPVSGLPPSGLPAVVAAAFQRCMEVLAARMSMGVPSTIPPPDEERERRRIAIKLMQEHIALLEAQESVLRRMSQQG